MICIDILFLGISKTDRTLLSVRSLLKTLLQVDQVPLNHFEHNEAYHLWTSSLSQASFTTWHILRMPVIINLKAISWKRKIILAIVCLIFFVINDILVSTMIALAYLMSDQWIKLGPREFVEFKHPIEMLLLFLTSILTTALIFGYT